MNGEANVGGYPVIAWLSAFLIPIGVGLLMHPTTITKIGPNGFVGYRFGVIATNDEIWEAAHRAAWPVLRWCMLLAAIGSSALSLIQLLGDGEFIGHIAALQACGLLLIATIGGMIKASNAAQDRFAELETDPLSNSDP